MGQEEAGHQGGATLRVKGGALTLLMRAPLQLADESSVFSLQRLGSESINTIQSTPETQYKGSCVAADDNGGGGGGGSYGDGGDVDGGDDGGGSDVGEGDDASVGLHYTRLKPNSAPPHPEP